MDAKRMLAGDASIGIVYDVDGYVADDDVYEAGVVVDEPSMAEELSIPEDQVDPDIGKTEDNDDGVPKWIFIVAGFATLAIIATLFMVCRNKPTQNVGNDTLGNEMQDINHQHMTHVDHRM